MSEIITLVARGLWDRDGKPWQRRLQNHSLVEGHETGIQKPYFPPEIDSHD